MRRDHSKQVYSRTQRRVMKSRDFGLLKVNETDRVMGMDRHMYIIISVIVSVWLCISIH